MSSPDEVTALLRDWIDGKEEANPIGRLIGHYQVQSLLGAGGMGKIYLAEDTQLRRKVAIKLLRAELTHDGERARRFAQEARAASALTHPNIITIHESGEDDDRLHSTGRAPSAHASRCRNSGRTGADRQQGLAQRARRSLSNGRSCVGRLKRTEATDRAS